MNPASCIRTVSPMDSDVQLAFVLAFLVLPQHVRLGGRRRERRRCFCSPIPSRFSPLRLALAPATPDAKEIGFRAARCRRTVDMLEQSPESRLSVGRLPPSLAP